MKAQRHQMAVALHLAARCKNQKGMLVYHNMGSGKTLTALVFAMSFPEHRVVIVTPEEIQFTWKAEIKKMKLKRQFEWHTYNSLTSLKGKLSGAIVILDEVHNFIDGLDDLRLDLMNEMRDSFKILLLTGTPISSAYSGWNELVILINMAAGKEVLPFNKTAFNREYMIVDRKQAMIWGYIDPIIRHYHWVWAIYWRAIKTVATNTFLSFVSVPWQLTSILRMVGLLQKPATPRYEQQIIEQTLWEEVQGETMQRLNPLNVLQRKWSLEVQKKVDRIIFGNFLAYYYREKRLGLQSINSLNVRKLGDVVAPYVSFYSIEKDAAYPRVKNHIESVPYDDVQHALYVKLQAGLVDMIDMKALRKTGNEAEAGYYSDISEEAYGRFRDASRRISGLCFPERHYFAPKFDRLIKLIDRRSSRRVVVYSEFVSTYQYLQLYLASIERPFQNLDINLSAKQRNSLLQRFESGEVEILLLHPKLTEGISIKGATQMHILEPQKKLHSFQQVAARVVRFMSHSHLPAKERHVDIYLWQAVLSNDAIQATRASILQTKESLKQWWASNKEVVPPIPILLPSEPFRRLTNRFIRPASDQTEEECLQQRNLHMDVMLEKFSHHLKSTTLPTGPVDCCVWNPDKRELSACLKTKPACAALYKKLKIW